MKSFLRNAAAAATLGGALVAISMPAAAATEVVPASYTFDVGTACGSWCYHDPGFTKLTDGLYGTAGWARNAGAEWAGWVWPGVVNIDFDFGAAKRIDTVMVGSTQDDLSDVVLPSVTVWEKVGADWVSRGSLVVPASAANNVSSGSGDPHGFLTLSGLGINSRYVRVSLGQNGPWVFADEVNFLAPAVPEPETYAMMLAGLGLLGAAARRKRQA